MFRRLAAIFFALLTIHGCSIFNAAIAMDNLPACAPGKGSQLTVCAIEEVPTYFKSGAKYDTEKHRWTDRYNGKVIDLGLPGVAGRYGAQNVVADNDLIASGPGSAGTTTTNTGSHYKQWLLFTLLGLGIATSIAVPIALGVHHHHNHHHQQLIWQRNQVAAYYYFHNQTLPIPKLILPPPPPMEHAAPPPPPPGN